MLLVSLMFVLRGAESLVLWIFGVKRFTADEEEVEFGGASAEAEMLRLDDYLFRPRRGLGK